jgi:hypothetical protein
MRPGQHFRRGWRYCQDGTEHPGDCGCGRCLDFEKFVEEKICGKGFFKTRMINGKPIQYATR